LAQAAPEWGDNHEHFSVFRRQATEVSSIISSGQRAQRGQVALLRGIWQRIDYTNDLLLALLNHQRFVVSPHSPRLGTVTNPSYSRICRWCLAGGRDTAATTRTTTTRGVACPRHPSRPKPRASGVIAVVVRRVVLVVVVVVGVLVRLAVLLVAVAAVLPRSKPLFPCLGPLGLAAVVVWWSRLLVLPLLLRRPARSLLLPWGVVALRAARLAAVER
jgi:hypothetical protein